MASGPSNDRLHGRKTLNVSGFLEEFAKDDIKKQVDIVSLFSSFGVELIKTGNSHSGLCPFHDDHNPSLSVDQSKGLFNCFSCGASGDVIDAVKLLKGVEFKEALSFLKNFNGSAVSTVSRVPARPQAMPDACRAGGNPPTRQVKKEPDFQEPPPRSKLPTSRATEPPFDLSAVAEYYHKQLLSSREAKAYLTERGLTDPELYSRFQLGYADGSLLKVLSKKQHSALEEIGILKNGREHFKGCITVPLFDEQQKIVGFYGRKIGQGQPAHLYLPGVHKGLFNRKALAVYPEEIILTESVIDALSLLQLGLQNVLPCYGIHGFVDPHLHALQAARTKTVVIAFDNDEAGKKGSDSLRVIVNAAGCTVKQIVPAGVKDWNEFLTTGGSKAVLEEQIKNAKPFAYERPIQDKFSVQKNNGRYQFTISDRQYRVLGVKQGFVSNLRVNIRFEQTGSDPSINSGQCPSTGNTVSLSNCSGQRPSTGDRRCKKHIDNVDLYSARSRAAFAQQLESMSGISQSRVEHDLISILDYLEEERDKEFAVNDETPYELSEEEKQLGYTFLTTPNVFDQIVNDLETLGYVGEEVNKLLMYLAASSRKLGDPISVIVLSQSAAGKSYLIDTVKKCLPPEDVVSMTSLSDQALNYLPEDGLLHKFLVMGEAVHGEVIEHQVREMLSAHELSRLVTMKDPKTGELSSRTVRKEVIVSAVMSSTNHNLNQENASRCFVINTDESAAQTRSIHEAQRKKYSLERYRAKEALIPEIIKKHQAAQRLLKHRLIINPFAEHLRFPDTQMRSRRDHERFIDLIACVCFLRQFQKKEQTSEDGLSFIECDLEDYTIAYRIMTSILPSTLTNFPKSALELYETLRQLIREKAEREGLQLPEVSLTQREIREATDYTQMFVKRNMRLLAEYEYVLASSGRNQRSRKSYRLIADEPISLLDLTMIPDSEEMMKVTKGNL